MLAIAQRSHIREVQSVMEIADVQSASKKGQRATMQIKTWLNKTGYKVNPTESQLIEKCNSQNSYTDELCKLLVE